MESEREEMPHEHEAEALEEQNEQRQEEQQEEQTVEPTPEVHDSPFPGSRLMIREMVLENFKSYAGEVRIGPFHKCFSSVVGPNGSGKSNTIDAMLFVFGKRAKKLRLNKVSELIHSSTEHPDCEYAKVTVYFHNIIDREAVDDDDEGYDVVPGSELEVSRVAFQSNKSDYFVDGKRMSFTEVSTLLMKRGIDLQNNRFLILQGEVEQISLMKPKAPSPHEDGLLEYLEDIIGSNKYTEAIEAAAKQVEELGERRTEQLNRVKVVEKDKESLEDAKNEAEAFLQKDRLLTQKRAWRLQSELKVAQAAVTELETKREALAQRIEEESSSIDCNAESRKALEQELKQAQDEHEALLEELSTQKRAFAQFEDKDIKLREEVKHATTTIKNLKKAIAKQESLVEKHTSASEALKESIPQLQDAGEQIKAHRQSTEEKLEQVYESLQGETSKLRAELETKQEGLAPLSMEATQAKSNLDVVLTEIELLESSVTANKQSLTAAEEKIEALEVVITSRPKEIQAAEKDLEKAEEDLVQVNEQLEATKAKEEELQVEVRNGRTKTEAAKASLASTSNRGALLSSLAEAKATKGNPISSAGLLGRLGDLGCIDPKFDVAISTACGGLDNLVTSTTKGAETCVKYLRDHSLGRATFAILDKLGHLESRMNKVVETPEGVPRLFDLIEPADDKFRPAFYHAMRDTLVAEDLDQAVRIAYQGNKCVWRVVTLKGQVIDTSGTMSGGGGRAQKGRMKLLSASKQGGGKSGRGSLEAEDDVGLISKEQVAELERSTAQAIEELTTCRKERQKLSNEKIRLESLIEDLKLMLPKLQVEHDEMQKQLVQLQENVEELRPQCELSEESEDKLKELMSQRKKLELVYNKAQKKLEALETETSTLHQKITDVGGPRVAQLKDSLAELEQSLEKNRKAIQKANSDVKTNENKAAKATLAFKEAETEQAQLQERIKEIEVEIAAMEEDATQVLHKLEEAKEGEKAKKRTLDDIVRRHAEQRAQSNKIEKVLVDMKNQLVEYDEQDLPKKRGVLNNLNKRISELKSHYAILVQRAALDAKREKTRQATIAQAKKRAKTTEQDEVEEQETSSPPRVQKETGGEEDDEDEADKEEESETEAETEIPELLLRESQLEELDLDILGVEIQQLDAEVNKLKNVVNMSAIKEYMEREREYCSRVEELDGATRERDQAREACEELRKRRLTEFMAGFSQITLKLKEMYQMITLGGDAELELVDSCDPFSEGIVFSVRPPKKSWKNISNLSGGEKTLSSLALVFALHHYKPTPLYVMDEIDAALDHKNVSIVGNYIKERTKNAQFVIISLRNNMFELADRLVGIYKTHDATKSITINPAKVVAASKAKAKSMQEKASRQPLSTINR